MPFWEDSKSGGPKLVPFLIRQENTKYSWKAGVLKFDPLHFGRFNLYQDPFFEEIMNLATELLYFAWAMCYAQNGDWGPGGGLEMFSDWDDLTCVWTGFSRRIHIWIGKFEILTVAPDMARSMIVAEMTVR